MIETLWGTPPSLRLRLGGQKMGSYSLYYLLGNALTGSDSIEAADDMEAKRIARERADGRTVEVWNGYERVGVLARPKPKAAASGA